MAAVMTTRNTPLLTARTFARGLRRTSRCSLLFACHAGMLLGTLPAHASDGLPEPSIPSRATPQQALPQSPDAPFPYHYHGERRFGVWDYVGTAATIATYLAVETQLGTPHHATLGGGLPVLDHPVRNLLAADTRGGRRQAAALSDRLWQGTIAF